MDLLILSQYYPPEIGAPQARLSELAKRIVAHGHRVSVLTAMPNYPTGQIYKGYGGIYSIEYLEGIKVYRTFIYPTQKTNFIHRLTNYFSFILSSIIVGSIVLPDFDFILVESPPLFLGLSGLWLSFFKKANLIFNVSDLWPESAVELGILNRKSCAFRLSSYLESLFYRHSWVITGQSKSILRNISNRFPEYRTYHLSNGVDTSLFHPDMKREEIKKQLNADGKIIVIYAGLHGLAQGLDQIINAAAKVINNNSIRFILVGDGPEKQKLQMLVAELQLNNICFLPPKPRNEIPALLATADIALVPLKKHLTGAVPSKIYEAMACSVPVILIAEGEAAEIISQNQAGVVVSPGDISELVRYIKELEVAPQLRQRMGANGREATELYFNRDRIVNNFIEYLEQNT